METEEQKTGTEKKEEEQEVQKVQIEHKVAEKTLFEKIKSVINWLISLALLILAIYVAMTIKNALDDTMAIETKTAQKMCGHDACIIIDGIYEKGFVEWNVREYWPFFAISIGTSGFEERQEVDIICPVELKTNTFQHILTKFVFLYKKNNIKSCRLSPA
jgi:hypothetical protein